MGEELAFDRSRALQLLFMQTISQPFFAELRTKQQFGYLVSASAENVFGLGGVQFRVQSATKTTQEIEEAIKYFLEEQYKPPLEEEREKEFQEFKLAVVAKLREKPKRLTQAFSERYQSIALRTFDFDWKERVIASVLALERGDLEGYVTEFKKRPRLWLRVSRPGEEEPELEDLHLSDFQALMNDDF